LIQSKIVSTQKI
jgi:hypothetical protein